MTPFQQGTVRGFIHRPEADSSSGYILTHGAGGNCAAPLLVNVANALAATGATVLRCDLPFRQRRSFGPPTPAMSQTDRAGLADAVAAMRKLVPGTITLGGHSYGGRQSTLLAAEKPGICDALLLFSYPLHPPSKPLQARTAHFPRLETPALFIHGTKDPFGTVEEMQEALQLIPAKTDLMILEGAGHDLNRGKFDLTTYLLRPLGLSE